MSVFVVVVLTLTALGFVAYPLWKQRVAPAASPENERLDELQSRRDTTYSMLKELEFDYQSGILSGEDYKDLEGRYKGRAISILMNIDAVEHSADVADEIEREILNLRQVRGEPVQATAELADEIENEVRKLRQPSEPAPAGLVVDPADEIEEQVTKLRQPSEPAPAGLVVDPADEIEEEVRKLRRAGGRFCTQCGTRAHPGDCFCAGCGVVLESRGR